MIFYVRVIVHQRSAGPRKEQSARVLVSIDVFIGAHYEQDSCRFSFATVHTSTQLSVVSPLLHADPRDPPDAEAQVVRADRRDAGAPAAADDEGGALENKLGGDHEAQAHGGLDALAQSPTVRARRDRRQQEEGGWP